MSRYYKIMYCVFVVLIHSQIALSMDGEVHFPNEAEESEAGDDKAVLLIALKNANPEEVVIELAGNKTDLNLLGLPADTIKRIFIFTGDIKSTDCSQTNVFVLKTNSLVKDDIKNSPVTMLPLVCRAFNDSVKELRDGGIYPEFTKVIKRPIKNPINKDKQEDLITFINRGLRLGTSLLGGIAVVLGAVDFHGSSDELNIANLTVNSCMFVTSMGSCILDCMSRDKSITSGVYDGVAVLGSGISFFGYFGRLISYTSPFTFPVMVVGALCVCRKDENCH